MLRASLNFLRIGGDEIEHLPPGFRRGFGEFGGTAVEEAVRRVGIDDNLVGNVRLGQLLLEFLNSADRDALVCSTEEAEDRVLDILRHLQYGLATDHGASQTGVEADDANETEVGLCAGEERERAAHAEAKREGGVVGSLAFAQALQPGLYILLEGLKLHLLDVRPELKCVVAGCETGGAAKIVDCQRADTLLREA